LIRTVLFDFGNVIAFFDHRRAIRRFAPQCDMPESKIYSAMYDSQLEHDFESGRIDGETYLQQASKVIGYRGNIDELRAAYIDIFTPNPPVLDLIPRLASSVRLVLASNTNELHSAHFRQKFPETFRHFHSLGMSFEAGYRKPAPEFFQHCLQLADCPPSEALFVDDMLENVEGAAAVGLRSIRYHAGDDLAAQLREFGVNV
jgi:glucose-1-phosphatase